MGNPPPKAPSLSAIVIGIAAIVFVGFLHHLKNPGSFGDDSLFRFVAYVITATVAGFYLLRVTKQTNQSAGINAVIATMGVCLPCFLFLYFVFPGRYIENLVDPYRIDWLTGQCQEQVKPCLTNPCHWKDTKADW